MGFFDMFRRGQPVATRTELTDFIDAQAAFLAQKGMFEYSRARAGVFGNILFDDKSFLAELERARWIAFAVTLGMVAEAVEGEMRPAAGERSAAVRAAVHAATLEGFDRYPVPASLDPEVWARLRETLDHDLALMGLHPIKRVMDIPARFVDRYLAAMPIHEKLRAKDDVAIHNFLKTNLCHTHEAFSKRADIPALIKVLTAA